MDDGSKLVIGSPATVASGKRTVRLITVWKTLSPNPFTTSASTSRECSVRESYMVASRPSMPSLGLSRVDTLSIVSISSATPRMREVLALQRHQHARRRRPARSP